MKFRFLWTVAGVLLIATAGVVVLVQDKPLVVEWTTATAGEMTGAIIAAGHIAQGGISPVYVAKPGTISGVYIVEGESVATGDTLIRLDDLEERARRARCAVDVTIATLRLEEQSSKVISLAREMVVKAAAFELLAAKKGVQGDSLFLQGAITRSMLDEIKLEHTLRQSERVAAETELAAASSTGIGLLEAELSQARLSFDAAERVLAQRVVTAQAEGIVAGLTARIGGRALPGHPLLQITPDEPPDAVNVNVGEDVLSKLHTGQQARVAIDRGTAVDAFVKSVGGRVDTATGMAIVGLSIGKSSNNYPAGRRVVARIATDEETPGAILLDKRFRSGTGHAGQVMVKSGDYVLRRQVRSADIADDIIYIYRGLTPGDTIVYAAGLSESSRIRLARKPVGNFRIPGL